MGSTPSSGFPRSPAHRPGWDGSATSERETVLGRVRRSASVTEMAQTSAPKEASATDLASASSLPSSRSIPQTSMMTKMVIIRCDSQSGSETLGCPTPNLSPATGA